MELCTARGISNLLFHRAAPPPTHISNVIQCRAPFPAHLKQYLSTPGNQSGPRYTIISCLNSATEATTYEAEASTYGAASSDDKTAVMTSPEDTLPEVDAPEETVPETAVSEANSDIKEEPESDSALTVDVVEPLPVANMEDYISQPDVVPQGDDSLQLLKFLEDLNIKFDYEDKYSILAWGVGGLIALRIAVAVVGAIDSIPLLPKVFELVGLGYSIWFATRYLIFEEKREEFVARVKQFKEETIG